MDTRGLHKDVRRMVKAMEHSGYTFERTGKSHVRVLRDGETVTVFPGTASDYRSIRNTRADIRRYERARA